jgi:DNA modification methylase
MKIGNGEWHTGDCLDVMRTLPDASVDMVVTSPPYDDMRTYNGSLTDWCFETFVAISDQLIRVVRDGGVIVWNVGDATVNGSETGSSFRQVLSMVDRGMRLADTMIWEKTGSGALGSQRIYGQNFEYMFILSKGRHDIFNPIKDRENVIKSGKVSTNGGLVEGKGRSRTVERQPFGKRTNIWRINPQQKSFHTAPFPIALAQDHILSWSNLGALVLDPFGGSGTTAIAAERAGRKWICIERDEEYAVKAIQRIRDEVARSEEEIFA